MRNLFLVCAALLCALLMSGAALAQAPNGCSGTPNLNPIYTNAPVFVRQVPNGLLYVTNQVSPSINVVHLYGTPYEMGFAHGSLLKGQIVELYEQAMSFFIDSMNSGVLKYIPEKIKEEFVEKGGAAALQLTADLTAPYTPHYFYEELEGLSNATGIPYSTVLQVHMIPELIKAHCTMFGAWGPAIANTDGTLVQLRALDWGPAGPMQQYPTVLVYHPNEGNGVPFSLVTWSGIVFALTGMSSSPVAICEKVWLSYNGTDSREGYPWQFLLRDILQYDTTVASALTRIANARRTCSIFVGVGDGWNNNFRIIYYAHDYIEIYDDKNFPAYTNHPLMDGLVYLDKHNQPSANPCIAELLNQYYGNITAPITIKYLTSQMQTGDLHIAVYDYKNMYMYVSNAGLYTPNQPVVGAYDRAFTQFDMSALFAQTQK